LRLLLVEDSASEAARLRELLIGLDDPPVRVELASTVAGALGALRKRSFDVVMLDLALPDGHDLEGLRRVLAAAPASAVIVRTGQSEEQLGSDAVAVGAHDYMVKEAAGDLRTVERSIRVALARRRGEGAARELTAVVASCGEAIIGLAPDRTISSWNPAAEEMYGYTATEAVGREILFLTASDGEAARLRRALERIYRGQSAGALECRHRRADGSELEAALKMVATAGPEDRHTAVIVMAHDVTELRATELALHSTRAEQVEQSELLAAVVDDAPIGLAIVQLSGNHPIRVNRALCWLLGYTDDELRDGDLLAIVHPEDLPRVQTAVGRLLEREIRSYQTEVRFFHREGQVVWAELTASLIQENRSEPRHLVVQVSDISGRKQVERALQQERDHTAAILAAIGEGYALSMDGRLTEVNDALCSLTGYSRQELIGAGQPWPFWPRPTGLWSPDLSGAPPEQEIVAQLIRRDGSRFEAELKARAAHNPDGSVLGWVIAVRDVGERRRYEAELERLATHDPLTGLANHRLFHQRLGEEVAMARRYGRPLSIVILDLDHFKQINDAHGHLTGDQALVAVAQRLAQGMREGELLARVGGEEFAWLLPEADEEGAQIAAERGRSAVSAAELPAVGRITISAGLASLEPDLDASALYDRADQALLNAKREGRDRTVRWSESRVVR
jgi:diguanylate cyclase (GGDEF)-like protein/PAS domain S-box-containing protein